MIDVYFVGPQSGTDTVFVGTQQEVSGVSWKSDTWCFCAMHINTSNIRKWKTLSKYSDIVKEGKKKGCQRFAAWSWCFFQKKKRSIHVAYYVPVLYWVHSDVVVGKTVESNRSPLAAWVPCFFRKKLGACCSYSILVYSSIWIHCNVVRETITLLASMALLLLSYLYIQKYTGSTPYTVLL